MGLVFKITLMPLKIIGCETEIWKTRQNDTEKSNRLANNRETLFMPRQYCLNVMPMEGIEYEIEIEKRVTDHRFPWG